MLKRLLFIIFYILAWTVFFEIARIYFLLSAWQYTSKVPADLIFQSLRYGLKMDISMASYIAIPVCLFIIAGLFIPFFRKPKIYIIYTGIILFIQNLLIVADAELYKAWGSRIDFTAFKYLSSPKEMWASVSHLPLFWIFLGLFLIFILLFFLFRKLIRKITPLLENTSLRWIQLVLTILFTGLLIIPIRGGFQLSPLNQSSVYFSSNQFANNAALNASWNLMYSVTKIDQLSNNPYLYMSEELATKMVNKLFESGGKTEQVVNVSDSAKPNVILIIWESFTEKVLNEKFDGERVIKYFPELIKEGIYFSNCYCSGDRTDKGISAIMSSYPALPKGSIVNYPDKNSRLPGIGSLLLDKGYATNFYYGGEPEFANIKSYLTAQRFQKLITKSNFNKEDMNSKWGAHDNVVMKKILNDLPDLQQPFFTSWLTLSSHEPFETPVPKVFSGNDKQTKFFNSLHFTDSVIYTFINELKKQPAWNNTLVIISADHGHYLPVTGKRADDFRIPVLWLGGALTKKNVIVKKTVSQLDIASSIFHQFHFSNSPFRFGKNVFDSSSKNWAFFTFNDGVGFITDSSRLLYDNVGRRAVFEEGKTGKENTEIAKALMQTLYADFLKR